MKQEQLEGETDDYIEPVAWPEIFQNPKITKAINTAVDAWATNLPTMTAFKTTALISNLVFGLLVFLSIGLMGYFEVISKDVAGTLIGSLIGYWYGRYQSGN